MVLVAMSDLPLKAEAAERADILRRELEKRYPGRVSVSELLKSTWQVQVVFPFDGQQEHERIMAEKK